MIVFLLAVVILLIGAVVAVVLGRTGTMSVEMAEPARPLAPLQLPDGPLGPDDLALVRLDRSIRGYRMDQVDDLLDRLRVQLAAPEPQLSSGSPSQPPRSPSHWPSGSSPALRPGLGTHPPAPERVGTPESVPRDEPGTHPERED